jgi:hypothetical protein
MATELTAGQLAVESADVLLLPDVKTAREAYVEHKHEALGQLLGWLVDGAYDEPSFDPHKFMNRLNWLLADLGYTMDQPTEPRL